ncbi:MAG: TOBE domain-containing protein [Anaerolineales bacterium]|nr:TOBE domain-containing protein [Anaerolineales bacterium]
MNRGRYEQLGDPEALYERPETRFVAGFLGVSNLLPATAAESLNGHAAFRLSDGSTVRVPAGLIETGRNAVSLGVRPEKIRLIEVDKEVPAGMNRAAGTIVDASYLGVSTQYIVALRDGSRVTVYEQNVERATKAELWARGEEVVMALVARPLLRRRRGERRHRTIGGRVSRGRLTARGRTAMTDRPILEHAVTRRAFLAGTSMAGFAAFLAACNAPGAATPTPGGATTGPTEAPTEGPSAEPTEKPSPAAELNFANWPLYIDTDDEDETKHKTLEDFTAEYGTVVNYSEVINDNNEFFRDHPGAARGGPGYRLGHHRPDRVDGRPHRPSRLGREADLGNVPNYVNNLVDVYKGPDSTRTTSTTRRGRRA